MRMTEPQAPVAAILADLDKSGVKVSLGEAFLSGETRSAHLVVDVASRQWVLKWADSTPDAMPNLERLVRLVDRLRNSGYPAPAHFAIGTVDQWAYWLQERLPGDPIHSSPRSMPDERHLASLARELVALAVKHEGAGDLPDLPWPGWLVHTLVRGGDGYCLHETMRRTKRTAQMLDEIIAIAHACSNAPVRRHDITHFDFSYTNALTAGVGVTGVIDWNVPFDGALQGDLAFDIATLLFYAYDRPSIMQELWRSLLEWADPRAAGLYLSHLTLRQVEWVERFCPGTYQHERFLKIGTNVLKDLHRMLSS